MSSFFRKPFGGGNSSSKSSPNKSNSSKSTKSSASQAPSTLSTISGGNEVESLGHVLTSTSLNTSLGVVPKHLLPAYTEQTILDGNVHRLVGLPIYVDQAEWVLSHLFEFSTLISALYDIISDDCTERKCGHMTYRASEAGDVIPLGWSEDLPNQLAQGLPLRNLSVGGATLQAASSFIDCALNWIDQQLEDPQVVPIRSDGPLSEAFEEKVARPVFSILYLVISHIYWHHFDSVISSQLVGHLNSLFSHFMAFIEEFQLLAPLDIISMKPFFSALVQKPTINT